MKTKLILLVIITLSSLWSLEPVLNQVLIQTDSAKQVLDISFIDPHSKKYAPVPKFFQKSNKNDLTYSINFLGSESALPLGLYPLQHPLASSIHIKKITEKIKGKNLPFLSLQITLFNPAPTAKLPFKKLAEGTLRVYLGNTSEVVKKQIFTTASKPAPIPSGASPISKSPSKDSTKNKTPSALELGFQLDQQKAKAPLKTFKVVVSPDTLKSVIPVKTPTATKPNLQAKTPASDSMKKNYLKNLRPKEVPPKALAQVPEKPPVPPTKPSIPSPAPAKSTPKIPPSAAKSEVKPNLDSTLERNRQQAKELQRQKEAQLLREQELARQIAEKKIQEEIKLRQRQKEKEKVQYSSFGKRDPFIPIEPSLRDPNDIDVGNMNLVGVIWDRQSPMAVLEHKTEPGISITLREGDNIPNGKVYRIHKNEIIFTLKEFGTTRSFSLPLISLTDGENP